MWFMKSLSLGLLNKEGYKTGIFPFCYTKLEEALLFIDMTRLVLH